MCYGIIQETDNSFLEKPSMVEEVPSMVEELSLSSYGSVIEPKLGMSFKTEHEVIDYYKQYGK